MRERVFLSRGLQPSYISGRFYDYNRWNNYSKSFPIWHDYFVSGMIDVVTNGYRAKSRDGQIINNPMWSYMMGLKQTKMRLSCEGMCQYYVIHEPEVCLPGDFTPGASPMNVFIDSICSQFSDESSIAQAQAWANIDVSEIQGLASLGELPETVKMLIDTLKSAMKLTIAMKRGDLATIAKSAKKVGFTVDGLADLWLGYRYGVRPLIADIQNLLAAVSADLEKGKRFTSRGKYKVADEYSFSDFRPHYCNQSGLGLEFTETTEYSRVFRAGVLVMIDRSIGNTAAIWGLDSPIEAAWELVPFSFIIDWFTNIGDVIGALILNPGLTPLSSWVTETVSRSVTRKATGVHDFHKTKGCWQTSKPVRALDPFCKTTSWYTVKRRVPLAERYSLPSLNVRLDVAKLTDLALIARKLF